MAMGTGRLANISPIFLALLLALSMLAPGVFQNPAPAQAGAPMMGFVVSDHHGGAQGCLKVASHPSSCPGNDVQCPMQAGCQGGGSCAPSALVSFHQDPGSGAGMADPLISPSAGTLAGFASSVFRPPIALS